MYTIERLSTEHTAALLAFEVENREFFAASVPDRGDAYFAEFAVFLGGLLAEQDAGLHHFHVLVGEGGEIVGRVNVVDVAEGCAELGYRVGERWAGRGVATSAVRAVCGFAASRYGLSRLTAATTVDNPASHAVLSRAGFVVVGETTLGGLPGRRYRKSLVP